MRFTGSQKAKFIKYNLLALVMWLMLILAIIGGGAPDDVSALAPFYSNHPRLALALYILYGLIEIVGLGFIAYAFTFVVSPKALGLLCALGIYVAYLTLGSLVEFIVWRVRKSRGGDDTPDSPDTV